MKPGDRLITALVGAHQTGEIFKDWPLHVTIVAWFESSVPSQEIAQKLHKNLGGLTPFDVVMAGETKLGYHGKAFVNLVAQPTPFMEVQQRVEKTLDDLGVTLVAARGTWGEAYKPHVTVHRDRLREGDVWRCDHLYVVSQLGNKKRIDAEVLLA